MWLFGGMYGGERILSQSTVNTFLTMRSLNSHRGLGFDKPNFKHPSYSSITDAASAEVVGHTGFTGTSFWVDPKEDLIYISSATASAQAATTRRSQRLVPATTSLTTSTTLSSATQSNSNATNKLRGRKTALFSSLFRFPASLRVSCE